MKDEKKKQYTLRISNANRSELVVIIYDIFSDYLTEAKEAYLLGEEGSERFLLALRYARSCVRELSESLDFKYSPAMELFSLYRYVDRALAKAELKCSAEPLQEVETVMGDLREAFVEAAKKDQTTPVMENTQAVYAGLTYGKNQLNVDLSDQGSERGFRI